MKIANKLVRGVAGNWAFGRLTDSVLCGRGTGFEMTNKGFKKFSRQLKSEFIVRPETAGALAGETEHLLR